jgi:hypothetical protein
MQHNKQLQPFFARFLETQHKEQYAAQESNIPWPFPIPSSPFKDGPHTDKWPSDGDDDIPPTNFH